MADSVAEWLAAPEPTVKAVRHWVSCLPEDDINARHFTLAVEYKGDGKWAVMDGPFGLFADGRRDFKRLRGDRFDLDAALRLAKEQAPLMKVNGYTVADALARREARDADA